MTKQLTFFTDDELNELDTGRSRLELALDALRKLYPFLSSHRYGGMMPHWKRAQRVLEKENPR